MTSAPPSRAWKRACGTRRRGPGTGRTGERSASRRSSSSAPTRPTSPRPSTPDWLCGASTGGWWSAPSPPGSCSTAPASGRPPARSSSTTCSCSPAACSPSTRCPPAPAPPLPAGPARRVPGHRPDPARSRDQAHGRARRRTRAGRPLPPLPGRLFVVGDPKQSIYRFRRADIATYLRAGDTLGAERVVLSANFRSSAAVIDWVNGVFSDVIPPSPTCSRPSSRSTPAGRAHRTTARSPCSASTRTTTRPATCRHRCCANARRPTSPTVATALPRNGWWATATGAAPVPRRRHRRAAPCPHLAAHARGRAHRPRRPVPRRELLGRLRRPGDPPSPPRPPRRRRPHRRARPRRRPALTALRLQRRRALRLEDRRRPVEPVRRPARRASTAIRSPGRSPTSPRSPGGSGRAAPAELLDAIVEERRMLETALAGADARDVWRRVRYVVDQARAWTDAAAEACAATCGGRRSRPARAGRATRSCPSATTTPSGS